MFFKYKSLLACGIFAPLLLASCATEAWYEGMKRSAEIECRKQPATSADECLSRLNKQSYQEYEKERSGSR